MVTYYLKDPRSREKHEVQWTEDRVSVVSVKSTAAEKFNIPINEQLVVFGGRILKDDKSLADYCIKEGSTLHILRRTVIADKSDMSVEMESLEQDEDHQISNRQLIDNLVAEVVHHPRLLQEVLLNEEHTRSNPVSQARLLHPDMVERMRDPAYVRRLLEGNASLIAAVQQHLDSWDIFDEEASDPDYFADADDPSMGTSSEAMEGTPNQAASAAAMVSSSPTSSISSAHLATALARAQGRPSTLPVSGSPSSSTQLVSPFSMPQASSISPLQPLFPQQSATVQSQQHVTSPTATTISSDALIRALAGAMASTETPTRWEQQLQQIQAFGVWDQAACIRALEETGGDVEAAIELLVNEGIM